jgi:hypothetical protein
MTWIAVSERENQHFAPGGLGQHPDAPDLIDTSQNALMTTGSLVIETRLPVIRRPRHLVFYSRTGAWPLHLSLQAVPGGGLTLVLDQGGEVLHRTINHSEVGRTDVLRITYSWDSLRRWGQLAVERTDHDKVLLVPISAPRPLRVHDALALAQPGTDRYVAPEVIYIALSNTIEPVGPMPSLMSDTPIATPVGYRAISEMRRGDLVLTPTGKVVPVLQVFSRQVPASGNFRPVRMRAPYFGLQQDITISPAQRLVLSGSEVEYLFGHESVLVPARHLVGSSGAVPALSEPIVTYWQLLLPRHEALIAAGTVTESLFIGRLRRDKAVLPASILAGLDRAILPEHGRSIHPVLQAFEAVMLAENRAA